MKCFIDLPVIALGVEVGEASGELEVQCLPRVGETISFFFKDQASVEASVNISRPAFATVKTVIHSAGALSGPMATLFLNPIEVDTISAAVDLLRNLEVQFDLDIDYFEQHES